MKCLFIILNEVELLDDLLTKLSDSGIKGATILSSTGMARQLFLEGGEEPNFIGSLRSFLNPDRKESKTIICVLKDENLPIAKDIVRDVMHNFDRPDSGIMFSIPVNGVQGGCFRD